MVGQDSAGLLTQEQVAQYLQVSPLTVADWRWKGRGPRVTRVGRAPRYRQADVDAWLEEQQQTASERVA